MATDQRSLRVAPAGDPPGPPRVPAEAAGRARIEHDGTSHDAEHTCEMCEQIKAEMAATDSLIASKADSPVEVEPSVEPEVVDAEVVEPEGVDAEVVEPEVVDAEVVESEA